jgi:sulfite exporter TauE/SafE
MMAVEAVAPLTLSAAALMGLSFGAGPCNITCLPYLGPVFLAQQQRWQVVSMFSAGRLTGYTLLGAAAGALGQALDGFFAQSWGPWLLAVATLFMGLSLWRQGGGASCQVAGAGGETQTLQFMRKPTRKAAGGPFFVGLGLALNPCTPLATLLLAAAASQQLTLGAGLGLAFGLGATVVPALLFGVLVAHLGQEVRAHLGRWQPRLTRGAALALIGLGVATLLGWVGP